jgi:hypothetical protein
MIFFFFTSGLKDREEEEKRTFMRVMCKFFDALDHGSPTDMQTYPCWYNDMEKRVLLYSRILIVK